MKGYWNSIGYMGWTGNMYELFESEGAYVEYYRENIGE